ncbi:C40 family peptidase [Dermatobacter hominis]|uniref:C40 family peptidase n=1 Tax=Dermatobacter hominis TaxID=2884263 RepID=UPI001D11B2AD|nr:C40 family peptidase [Dermatobacter hominis]UDY37991.1 NlpC/P60 family protein [Dermatobacter hominis]
MPSEAPGAPARIGRAVRPVAVVAALALVIGASMAGTASAQDVEGQRAKVQRLAAEMDRLEAKASALDEQFLQTELEMDRVSQQVEQNRAAVADARSKMDEAKQQASSYIVSAYMSAGSDVAGLGVGDPNTAVNEKVLLETLHGDREQVADHLRAAQLDLDDRTAELDASSKVLEEQQAKQRSVKDDLEASVDEQQRLLDGANAELKAAVAAEQERKEQEAAAKAAAEAEARQRAAAAAAQTTTTAAAARAGAPGTTAAPKAAAKPAAPKPAAPAPSLPVAPVGSGAGAAIAAAQSVLGVPYKWAGASPSTGFDCSGLTMWAWARAGKSLPHSSSAQYAATQRISLDQLQPGDLVFFNNPISHVGLYIGGGMMIHAPHTGDVVKVSPITRMGKLVRAGRVA